MECQLAENSPDFLSGVSPAQIGKKILETTRENLAVVRVDDPEGENRN